MRLSRDLAIFGLSHLSPFIGQNDNITFGEGDLSMSLVYSTNEGINGI